ncbi:eukaryotic translation initiation factor 4E, partial [Coemansia sp. RSA 2703]
MTDVKTASENIASGEVQSVKTVLEDATNFNVVHRLNSPWTLWFDNQAKKANASNWTANLRKVVTMKTVEEFWGVYNTVSIA